MANAKRRRDETIRINHPDRRGNCRLATRLRVDFCPLVMTTSGDGLRIGGMQRGIAVNISQAGLFVTDVGYVQVGAVLHLFLRLPDIPANPVVCYAKVVRREPEGYGIRFLRVKQTDLRRLARYVDDLLEARYRAMVASR
jgi:hypothetical protein